MAQGLGPLGRACDAGLILAPDLNYLNALDKKAAFTALGPYNQTILF